MASFAEQLDAWFAASSLPNETAVASGKFSLIPIDEEALRPRQRWCVAGADFKVIVRAEADSTSKELGVLALDQVVVELAVQDQWLRHETGWSRISVQNLAMLKKMETVRQSDPRLLVVSNYSLYQFRMKTTEDGAQSLSVENVDRCALDSVLAVTQITDSDSKEAAIKEDEFFLHLRNGAHQWLTCETGKGAALRSAITATTEKLLGRGVPLLTMNLAQAVEQVISSEIFESLKLARNVWWTDRDDTAQSGWLEVWMPKKVALHTSILSGVVNTSSYTASRAKTGVSGLAGTALTKGTALSGAVKSGVVAGAGVVVSGAKSGASKVFGAKDAKAADATEPTAEGEKVAEGEDTPEESLPKSASARMRRSIFGGAARGLSGLQALTKKAADVSVSVGTSVVGRAGLAARGVGEAVGVTKNAGKEDAKAAQEGEEAKAPEPEAAPAAEGEDAKAAAESAESPEAEVAPAAEGDAEAAPAAEAAAEAPAAEGEAKPTAAEETKEEAEGKKEDAPEGEAAPAAEEKEAAAEPVVPEVPTSRFGRLRGLSTSLANTVRASSATTMKLVKDNSAVLTSKVSTGATSATAAIVKGGSSAVLTTTGLVSGAAKNSGTILSGAAKGTGNMLSGAAKGTVSLAQGTVNLAKDITAVAVKEDGEWKRRWVVLSKDNHLLHFGSPEEYGAFMHVLQNPTGNIDALLDKAAVQNRVGLLQAQVSWPVEAGLLPFPLVEAAPVVAAVDEETKEVEKKEEAADTPDAKKSEAEEVKEGAEEQSILKEAKEEPKEEQQIDLTQIFLIRSPSSHKASTMSRLRSAVWKGETDYYLRASKADSIPADQGDPDEVQVWLTRIKHMVSYQGFYNAGVTAPFKLATLPEKEPEKTPEAVAEEAAPASTPEPAATEPEAAAVEEAAPAADAEEESGDNQ